MNKHLFITFAVLVLLFPFFSFAFAEGAATVAPASDDAKTVTVLFQMIRWGGIVASVFVVMFAWLMLRFLDTAVEQLGTIFADKRLLFQKFSAFMRFAIYLVTGVLVIFLSFEFSKEVLAIVGGAVAVATGFAARDLVASLFAGILIIFDRPFQVGDRVTFGEEYGDIKAIGLRSVKLQTLDDNTVTIPNNLFLTGVTSCGNYGEVDMQVVVDFHIGVDQDLKKARALLQEAAASSRFVYLPKPIVVLVNQVFIENYLAIRLRLKAYVSDTKFEKQFETDVTVRALDAFDKHHILPPALLHRNYSEIDSAKQTSPREVSPA